MFWKAILGKFGRGENAAAAVEFAIVAPVFLLLMFGMLAYGIYLGATHSVEQLAADTARVALAGLDAKERLELAQDFIDKNAGEYPLLQSEFVKVELDDSEADSTEFRVSVEYNADNLPIWNLYKPIPLPGKEIVRSSIIRIGGT